MSISTFSLLHKTQISFKVSDVVSTLFEDFLSNSGITILSASSGEDVAYENKSIGNGAFTSAYINILNHTIFSKIFFKIEFEYNEIDSIYQISLFIRDKTCITMTCQRNIYIFHLNFRTYIIY